MKYLVLLKPAPGKTAADFRPHMVSEIGAVWSSYVSDELREFYLSSEGPVVTLVYELPDRQAVERAVDALPMVELGLLDRELVHLGPFQQISALFAPPAP